APNGFRVLDVNNLSQPGRVRPPRRLLRLPRCLLPRDFVTYFLPPLTWIAPPLAARRRHPYPSPRPRRREASMTPAPPPGAELAHDILRPARQPLDVFFSPTTVAVIGATETAGSVGRTVLWNLLSSPF